MKKNYLPTSRYLFEKIEREPHLCIPSPAGLPGIKLMAVSAPTEKMDWSADEFASEIQKNLSQNALVFCDTSFFTKAMDNQVWDLLLQRGLRITPQVRTELLPWLNSPCANESVHNIVADSLNGKNDKVEVVDITLENRELGFEHYFSLLCYRKKWGIELFDQLREQLGREPTEKEFNQHCNNLGKERGFKLASTGWHDRHKPNQFADEELVVLAIQTAIRRTSNMVIFTRDRDLLEQFLKMTGFLQHDYRAMKVADKIHSSPDHLGWHDLSQEWITSISSGQSRPPMQTFPQQVIESSLPSPFVPIHLHVVVVGPSQMQNRYKVSALSFCAEPGVIQLLRIKGKTGLNTDLFGELNCRLLTIKDTREIGVGIIKDHMTELDTVQVSEIDKAFALRVDEMIAPITTH